MNEKKLEIVLASPRGFCAGVDRAILIVEKALQKWGPPIYVRHEIVHNRQVVERLQAQGVIFVEEIEEIPKGADAIFSAPTLKVICKRKVVSLSLAALWSAKKAGFPFSSDLLIAASFSLLSSEPYIARE